MFLINKKNCVHREKICMLAERCHSKFSIESNITFQKRDKNLFQNFKTPFILMQFSNETIKWTKTAKQFLFYFHSFNFGF